MTTIIQEAKSKPILDPLFKTSSFTRCFLGVELEFLVKNSSNRELSAKQIQDLLGEFVILKCDASLVEPGFEICSRPATLEVHTEEWQKFFESDICKNELKVTDLCGMHVHINREPLSELQIGKIVHFIHSKENRKFIEKIAERESNFYCAFDQERKLTATKHNLIEPRRLGVNLHNKNTIEIRIFKSVTNFTNFLKNLEFCEALVRFMLPAKRSIANSEHFEQFITWLQNDNQYSNLIQILCQR